VTRLLIIGAGGHGRVVADTALRTGRWSAVAWIDDRMDRGASVLGFPVMGRRPDLPALRGEFSDAIVAIGDNRLRVAVTRELQSLGFACPALVDPAASVSARSTVGAGTVVFANATLAVDASAGCACILNHGCTVDHDCLLGDGVHICPGASVAGNVEVGHRAWIGIGSAVIHGVTIGMDAVVGAGAAVIRDVASGAVVAGVPAASLKTARARGSIDS